jgi:hypothetical protein
VPYQPLQRTIWPLAPGVQVILRKAPIPLLSARHCFLASKALLALCDPESRIQHSSGSRAPRPASPRVSSCLSLRASSTRQTSWRGPSRQTSAPYHTSTKLRASVAHASSSPPHPSTGRALRRTTPRPGLKFLECCALFAGCLLTRCVRMLRRYGSPFVITTVSAFLVPRRGRREPRSTR